MNQTSPNPIASDSQNDGLLSTSLMRCSKCSSCASDQTDNSRLICRPNKNGGQKTYSIGLGAIIKPIGEASLKNLFGFFVKCFCEMRIESRIVLSAVAPNHAVVRSVLLNIPLDVLL